MIIKKLLISLVSIFIIFVSSLLIIYTLFIYKPENLVQFIDRFLLDEYKIKYQDISSESKLLELKLGFKNLLLENNADQIANGGLLTIKIFSYFKLFYIIFRICYNKATNKL